MVWEVELTRDGQRWTLRFASEDDARSFAESAREQGTAASEPRKV